jgi:hypothetical protein
LPSTNPNHSQGTSIIAQIIAAPRGAAEVEPSIRGKPSLAAIGSSTGIFVSPGVGVCEQEHIEKTTIRNIIAVIQVDGLCISQLPKTSVIINLLITDLGLDH